MAKNPYTQYVTSTNTTPQSQPIPGKAQVKNNAGGYVFALDPWLQLERFLILGTEGGTYYVGERKLTKDNAKMVLDLLDRDGKRVVDTIRDVSINGRAYKQDPTLFALALAASLGSDDKSNSELAKTRAETRAYALAQLNDICRTGTMLFNFVGYVNELRGWGSALQKAVGNWYLDRTPDNLANQLVKYRQRNGWSHADLLRLSHVKVGSKVGVDVQRYDLPKGKSYVAERGIYNQEHPNAGLIRWTTGKAETADSRLVEGYLAAQATKNPKQLVKLIEEYGLPWEALPTEALNLPEVWLALAPHMGYTALLRNLGKMGSTGALVNHSDLAKIVNNRLSNGDALRKARVHPMQVLLASNTYAAGKGVKGSNTWTPVGSVVDTLTDAFYASFGNLEATNKRRLMCLDVSGSMSAKIMNTHLSCREAESALCLVAFQKDPDSQVMAFDTGLKPLNFSKNMRLPDAIKEVNRYNNFGGTDCALPMQWALNNKRKFDTFEVYTDNETWAGKIHPMQALRKYRDAMGINAKLVVNGMTATGFTIADPSDPGSLDVVGFDANAPKVIDDFIR